MHRLREMWAYLEKTNNKSSTLLDIFSLQEKSMNQKYVFGGWLPQE